MNGFDDPRHCAAAIIDYLARCPRAGDTAQGIARWWLGADRADWPQVRIALACLEREQAVVRYTAADGREHYRIGPMPSGAGGCV